MQKPILYWGYGSCLCAIGVAIYLFLIGAYGTDADGFSLSKATSKSAYDPRWDVTVDQARMDRIRQALDQTYTYLGKGAQSFVFLSQDGKYVFKLFRHSRFRSTSRLIDRLIPASWMPKRTEHKRLRAQKRRIYMERLFNGYKLGMEEFSEETGVEYIHLNKTPLDVSELHLVDASNQHHHINLSQYEFVLQKRARPLKQTFSQLMANQQIDKAYQCIDQLFNLIEQFVRKGGIDKDRTWIKKDNLGFCEDRAILLDLGFVMKASSTMDPNPDETYRKYIRRLAPLDRWFEEKYPQLHEYFIKKRDQELSRLEDKRAA